MKKMAVKFSKYLFAVFLVLYSSCAGNLGRQNEMNLKIDIVKLNAWVNLMPGKPNMLYINGNIKIRNVKNEFINELELMEIRLLQDDEKVSAFKPVFYADNGSPHISPGEEKFFTLKTPGGLKILDKLNMNKPLELLLEFASGKETYSYKVEKIKIEKIY